MTELETAQKRIAELEAELAAMRTVGEPVAYCDERVIAYLEDARSRDSLITTILAKERSYERPTQLYTHPQQAAHAERKPLTHEQAKDLVSKYGNDPLHLVFQVEVWHGIETQQGEKE